MKKLLLLLLLIPSYCLSAPTISGVTGDVDHDNSITISSTGTDFGSKSPAAPVYWNDFDDKSTDSQPQDWGESWSKGTTMYVKETNPYGGSKSLYIEVTQDYANSWNQAVKDMGASKFTTCFFMKQKIYMDYPFSTASAPKYQWKGNRISTDPNGYSSAYHTVLQDPWWSDIYDAWYNVILAVYTDTSHVNFYDNGTELIVQDQWMDHTMLVIWGTPDASDGEHYLWVDNHNILSATYGMNVESGDSPVAVRYFLLQSTFDIDPGGTYYGTKFYLDSLYLDGTQARVELGNASTYSTCTVTEIQIPTAWSTSSITATVNVGQFEEGNTCYIYVFDSNGDCNSAGYAVTIGSGGAPADTTAPSTGTCLPWYSQTNVSPTAGYYMEIVDAGSGISEEASYITVESTDTYYLTDGQFSLVGDDSSYEATWTNPDSPWDYGQEVNIFLHLQDNDGNYMEANKVYYVLDEPGGGGTPKSKLGVICSGGISK